MPFRTVIAAFLLLVAALPASAEGWSVFRVANSVQMSTDGKTWTSVSAGASLPNAAWVRTGPRGRVILARGEERIIYRGNTLAAFAPACGEHLATVLGTHPDPESVGLFPASVVWLERSFHRP